MAVGLGATASARGNRGFTLVEVLVVLIVIGLGAGLVTLGMGHDDAAALRQEAERLRSSLEYGAQMAQWRRDALIWEADGSGYRFQHATPEGLLEDETEPALARHVLPAEMRVRATGPAGTAAPLRLLLRASGRNDPYSIVIVSPAGSWAIGGDPLNRVRAAPSP